MGTQRELELSLWGVGVTDDAQRKELSDAIEYLEGAGDELSNALHLWLKLGAAHELPTSKTRKEAVAREAKMSAAELRKALHNIIDNGHIVLRHLEGQAGEL